MADEKELVASDDHEQPVNVVNDACAASSHTSERPISVVQFVRERNDKGPRCKDANERKRPLTLTELPMDILRLIIREITHTADLTALALTNSTLHNLAIPRIYQRFDIVWPDCQTTQSDPKSVDALTYGLSTLCLGSSLAHTMQRFVRNQAPSACRPRGNCYAKYARKFSLGNGPKDWVDEYLITKESGKMLGTLVAIALAKMANLETFIWDMPTGVYSEIFIALASLAEHHENGECNLKQVWVRWHDNSHGNGLSAAPGGAEPNSLSSPLPPGSMLTAVGILLPAGSSHPPPKPKIPYSQMRVEYPTFSVLPPQRSLTVLDIDELSYLDEMAILLGRSQNILEELRVGIAKHAVNKDFIQTWDGQDLQQIDHNARWPGDNSIGQRRLGGVLGILVGKIYDLRRKNWCLEQTTSAPSSSSSWVNDFVHVNAGDDQNPENQAPPAHGVPSSEAHSPDTPIGLSQPERNEGLPQSNTARPPRLTSSDRKRLDGKLKLRTLCLERVPISMHVCTKALDWSNLTSLTIFDCLHHEQFWKVLRVHFEPTPIQTGYGIVSSDNRNSNNPPMQYHLALKYIHTDITSLPLIRFIKETLAPNTLEVLFLQDRRRVTGPAVTVEQIFRGAVKRHHASLVKLLIDSSNKNMQTSNSSAESPSTRWKHWVLTHDLMLYITSGRMTRLKELSVSLHYQDWHVFLQRLPNLRRLVSLNIPYLVDQPMWEPKELALQVIDIITLRPEMPLSYLGLLTKCYEIQERSLHTSGHGRGQRSAASVTQHNVPGGGLIGIPTGGVFIGDDAETTSDDDDGDDDEDDDEQDDTEDDDDGDNDDAGDGPVGLADGDGSDGSGGLGGDSDDDSFVEDNPSKVSLRLREILFYDDKIAIFKARHAKI